MKKFIFFAIACVAIFAFTSCDDETNGGSLKIEAKVVNGTDYNDLIDEVRAMTIHESIGSYKVATSKFENGGFKMTLPMTISSSAYSYDSRHKADCVYANFYAYKDNNIVGHFCYKSLSDEINTGFVYCYKGGTMIVRVSPADVGMELKMKKGWSIIYSVNVEGKLEKPDKELNWYFIPN